MMGGYDLDLARKVRGTHHHPLTIWEIRKALCISFKSVKIQIPLLWHVPAFFILETATNSDKILFKEQEHTVIEIRRRTRVVGRFLDGQSALMLSAARFRDVAGKKWGAPKYINMDHFKEMAEDSAA